MEAEMSILCGSNITHYRKNN